MVKQVSLFIENKQGRLERVLKILTDNEINIRALSLADTANFGILRLIVDKPEEAVAKFSEMGFRVSETKVLAVEVPDKPGGLALTIEDLAQENVNIDYMYAFLAKKSENAIVIFRVEDLEKAQQILTQKDIRVLGGNEIYNL